MENIRSERSGMGCITALRRDAGVIRYGDRVFVRVTAKGKVICEVIFHSINDRTELLSKLRGRFEGLRGLVTLYVRNMDRGWSKEQPLMLYNSVQQPKRECARKMFAPWETH